MLRIFSLLAVACLLIGPGCGSFPGAADGWSRSYALPETTVFDTLMQVLEEEGYLVDADRDAGRVVAEPGRRVAERPTLSVRLTPRDGVVVVDVQVRAGVSPEGPVSERTEAAVIELLHALDRRLQGFEN